MPCCWGRSGVTVGGDRNQPSMVMSRLPPVPTAPQPAKTGESGPTFFAYAPTPPALASSLSPPSNWLPHTSKPLPVLVLCPEHHDPSPF